MLSCFTQTIKWLLLLPSVCVRVRRVSASESEKCVCVCVCSTQKCCRQVKTNRSILCDTAAGCSQLKRHNIHYQFKFYIFFRDKILWSNVQTAVIKLTSPPVSTHINLVFAVSHTDVVEQSGFIQVHQRTWGTQKD